MSPTSGRIDWDLLRERFDALLEQADFAAARQRDPVGIVWSYPPREREVVGLVAASLAYGQVAQLTRAIRAALSPLGEHPTQVLREGRAPRQLPEFLYRMTRGPDVVGLFDALGEVLRRHGSLHALFVSHMIEGEVDLQAPLSAMIRELRRHGPNERRGFRYLLPDPGTGGACKRMNLYLRWMVRGPDEIDFGLWDDVPAHKLAMPMDTHVARIATYVGILERKTIDWKAAIAVRDALRQLDPDDPLRYDFALCHLGISGACPRKRDPVKCRGCAILSVCRL